MTVRAKAASVDLGGGVWWYRGYYGTELDADNIFISETLVEPGAPADVAVSAAAASTDHPSVDAETAEVAVASLDAVAAPSRDAPAEAAAAAVAAPTPGASIRVSAGVAAVSVGGVAATSLEEVEPEIAAVPNEAVLGTLDPSQDLTWRRDTWAPDGLVYRSYSGASFTPVRSRSPRLGPSRTGCSANNALVEVT